MAAANESTSGAIGHYAGRARNHAMRAEDLARKARSRASEALASLPEGCAASDVVRAAVERAEVAAIEARAAARVTERIAALLCSVEGFDIALEMTKLARCAEAEAARAVQEVGQDVLALRSRRVTGRCQKCHGVCVEDQPAPAA